jgi:YidC/Oxa1 family membrane protein insertase
MFAPLAPIWNSFLYHPLLNILIAIYKLTGDLGWSIIAFTVGLRAIMTPLVIPSLKISHQTQSLAPELAKLKEKHKSDKQALALAQAALYKEHGINPAAGCLPQIVQIIVLLALFNALNIVLHTKAMDLVKTINPMLYSFNKLPATFHLSTKFLGLDLVKPDIFHISGLPIPLPGAFLLLAALVQFLSTKMMMVPTPKTATNTSSSSEDMEDAMLSAQQQMVYTMPLMTILFGAQFPFGLVLYWVVFSAVSMLQQYYVSGWGGLKPWLIKAKMLKS